MKIPARAALLMAALLFALPMLGPAVAQKADKKAAPAKKAAQPSTVPVSIEQALYLIRSTLLTLNDANRSGNYTVFRDLAAPEFQARHTAADLSQSFSDLRRRKFDLYGVALLAPQLTATPTLDAEKRLRLTGFFATRPQQIAFDLSFQVVDGQWRLVGMTIATPDAPPLDAQTQKQSGESAPK